MAKNDDKKGTGDLSFEDAIKDLTQIVAKIEGGETPLEDSIAQYERGMALITHCRGILKSAEKKIEMFRNNTFSVRTWCTYGTVQFTYTH